MKLKELVFENEKGETLHFTEAEARELLRELKSLFGSQDYEGPRIPYIPLGDGDDPLGIGTNKPWLSDQPVTVSFDDTGCQVRYNFDAGNGGADA